MSEHAVGPAVPPPPPQLSPDGQWWWTGSEWVRASQAPPPPPPSPTVPPQPAWASTASPAPKLGTALLGADMSPSNPINLLADEQIVVKATIHWVAAYGLSVGALTAAFVAFLIAAVAGAGAAGMGLFIVVAVFIAAPAVLIGSAQRRATEFVLTNRRIIAKAGLFNRHSTETLLHKVEGLSVKQTIVGSWLGFGTLVVHGVGGTKEPISCVTDPHRLRAMFQQQLTGWQQQR